MAEELVLYNKKGAIATITLNRPDRMNAVNWEMHDLLAKGLEEAAQDDEVRVLIFTGAGRAFCSGTDMSGGLTRSFAETLQQTLAGEKNRPGFNFTNFPKPTIAMVNGAAVGGGFELALACDMRIGSEKARFRMVFTTIGITPGAGGPWTLPRIVGLSKACKIIFSGDFVEAEEAYRIGLLDDLVPAERLEEETMAFARRLAEGPPIALRLDKMMIYKGLETDLETALAFQTACQNISLHSEDHIEGIRAFADKRKPVFHGR